MAQEDQSANASNEPTRERLQAAFLDQWGKVFKRYDTLASTFGLTAVSNHVGMKFVIADISIADRDKVDAYRNESLLILPDPLARRINRATPQLDSITGRAVHMRQGPGFQELLVGSQESPEMVNGVLDPSESVRYVMDAVKPVGGAHITPGALRLRVIGGRALLNEMPLVQIYDMEEACDQRFRLRPIVEDICAQMIGYEAVPE